MAPATADALVSLEQIRYQLQMEMSGEPSEDARDRQALLDWRTRAIAEGAAEAGRPLVEQVRWLPGRPPSRSGYAVSFEAPGLVEQVRSVQFYAPADDLQGPPTGELATNLGSLLGPFAGRYGWAICAPDDGWPPYQQAPFAVEALLGLTDDEQAIARQAVLLLISDYAQAIPLPNKLARSMLRSLAQPRLRPAGGRQPMLKRST